MHNALLYLTNGSADCFQIWCVGFESLLKCFPQVMGWVGHDTSLYASHNVRSLLSTQHSLQKDLDEIHKYGREWAITFNAAKTIQPTFLNKSQNQPPILTFGDVPIPINESHKHLGITFSNDLRFHEHVNEILNKVNKTISPLYPIAQHLPRHILDQIYKTYVRPHFDHCDTIYDGHITIRDSTRLETIQNRADTRLDGCLCTCARADRTSISQERLGRLSSILVCELGVMN